MSTRRTRGLSLIELLIAVAISAVIVAGAAAHFRTLRQTSDLLGRRRDAFQNARVALDRLGRTIRAAREVTDISAPGAQAGSLTVLDFDGNPISFFCDGPAQELHYEGSTSGVLARHITSFRLQGYDSHGAVGQNRPERMRAVRIELTIAVPGSSDTIDVATHVRLRNEPPSAIVRQTVAYASDYQELAAGGFANYDLAFGAPDEQFASPRDGGDARYLGFGQGDNAGPVHTLHVGLRLRYRAGRFRVRIYRDGNRLFDKSYQDSQLDGFVDTWDWLWIDLTKKRPSWDHTDIPLLDIEIWSTDNPDYDLDSLAIRAAFDEPVTTYVWADRQGDGQYPSEWQDPANATGLPDGVYATGLWFVEDQQSYRASAPSRIDIISAVHAAFSGYVVAPYDDDEIEVRTTLPTAGKTQGTVHAAESDVLDDYVGESNKGTILIDVTSDRDWTWDDLSNYEIRVQLKKRNNPTTAYMADAVGWCVQYVPGTTMTLMRWSEQ